METARIHLTLMRCAVPAIAAAALAGCFASEEPLISADTADYPFQSLTYLRSDSDEENPLVRVEGGYRPPSETRSPDRLLLKAVADDLYVVQISTGSSGPGYLYGLIRVSPDRKTFTMTASEAKKADLAAIGSGRPGLAPCDFDSDTICVKDLQGYVDYALQVATERETQSFTIVRMR